MPPVDICFVVKFESILRGPILFGIWFTVDWDTIVLKIVHCDDNKYIASEILGRLSKEHCEENKPCDANNSIGGKKTHMRCPPSSTSSFSSRPEIVRSVLPFISIILCIFRFAAFEDATLPADKNPMIQIILTKKNLAATYLSPFECFVHNQARSSEGEEPLKCMEPYHAVGNNSYTSLTIVIQPLPTYRCRIHHRFMIAFYAHLILLTPLFLAVFQPDNSPHLNYSISLLGICKSTKYFSAHNIPDPSATSLLICRPLADYTCRSVDIEHAHRIFLINQQWYLT